jgi:4-hydroxy-3-methylbut-2-enyl diphosphate reductase
MKIAVAQSAGFCFGVKRAIKMALDTAREGCPVEMLGDIVHNEHVVERIEASGIHKIDRLRDGAGRKLLIRAHGAAKSVFDEARRLGYSVVDATCPMVKEIHHIVEDFSGRGLQVIIIGDPQHEEVQGICGQIPEPVIIIDSASAVDPRRLRGIARAGVVVQSTQTADNVRAIVEVLRGLIGELEVRNTICRATTRRQQEIQTLPLENEVVLVIGSRSSANTRRLYELARALNPRAYWIQSRDDIDPAWFAGAASVGITAGASTPQETIDAVVASLAG